MLLACCAIGEGHAIGMADRAEWRSQPDCIANGRSRYIPLRRLTPAPQYDHCAGNCSLAVKPMATGNQLKAIDLFLVVVICKSMPKS